MKQLIISLVIISIGLGFVSFMKDGRVPEIGLEIGDQAPGFEIEGLDGKMIKLSDYKGRMVLLNFWASYDSQSRINSYNLTRLHSLYQDCRFENGQGFEVLSISLDRFKSPLREAIERDRTKYFDHACDYKGREGNLVKMYNIDQPVNILLDGEGRILVKDAFHEKLEKSLSYLELK